MEGDIRNICTEELKDEFVASVVSNNDVYTNLEKTLSLDERDDFRNVLEVNPLHK